VYNNLADRFFVRKGFLATMSEWGFASRADDSGRRNWLRSGFDARSHGTHEIHCGSVLISGTSRYLGTTSNACQSILWNVRSSRHTSNARSLIGILGILPAQTMVLDGVELICGSRAATGRMHGRLVRAPSLIGGPMIMRVSLCLS
jgi:hypothetical protein